MKDIAKALRRILSRTAILTTILMFAILIFTNITSDANINPALTLSTASVCLAASFLIALCNCIFRIRSISLFVRTILHFLACLLAVILTLALGSYELKTASLLLIVAFAVIYLAIIPAYLAISHSIYKKSKEEEDYDSIFSQRKS